MELKFYTIAELTKILNLHSKTILRFIHEGKIKAKKIGRSWMVSEDALKTYCHNELSGQKPPVQSPHYETLAERISVSAVVEINAQNSEEASRISNTFIAMLNSERGTNGKFRFDFFHYPESEKAKYVFYGTPELIVRILQFFDVLCSRKGDNNE